MKDLYEREQRILDNATRRVKELRGGGSCQPGEFEELVREYGRMLKQLRRFTKVTSLAEEDLGASKLDPRDKLRYDAVTGIYNRMHLEERLKRDIASISRSGGMLSVLMIDVDYSQKYNDAYGRRMGDVCLKAVAASLRSCIMRPEDYVARYGSDEFIAVLPYTDEDGARVMAARMMEDVRTLEIIHEKGGDSWLLTISIGGTTSAAHHTQSVDDYFARAEEALNTAKQGGRNRYTHLTAQSGV